MNNPDFSKRGISNIDLRKFVLNVGLLPPIQPSKKKKSSSNIQNANLNDWVHNFTNKSDVNKLELLNYMVFNAASNMNKNNTPITIYRSELQKAKELNIICNNDLQYFENPEAFFSVFCDHLYFVDKGIFTIENIAKYFSKNRPNTSKTTNKILHRLLKKLTDMIRYTNTYEDSTYTYDDYIILFSHLYGRKDIGYKKYLVQQFQNCFFYYNGVPVFLNHDTLLIASKSCVQYFFEHYFEFQSNKNRKESAKFISFYTKLSNSLFKKNTKNNLFSYSTKKDYSLAYLQNNFIYSYQYDKTTETFKSISDTLCPILTNSPSMLTYEFLKRNSDTYNFILNVTNQKKEIFNRISLLMANLLQSNSVKNMLHIILINEEDRKTISNLLNYFSYLFIQDNDIATFLKKTIGQYMVQQYRFKKAFLINSMDCKLDNKQAEKLSMLLNATTFTQKYKVNGNSQKLNYINNLTIIGISTDRSFIENAYKSFQTNIIDLRSSSFTNNLINMNHLFNWIKLPWTLYGIQQLENQIDLGTKTKKESGYTKKSKISFNNLLTEFLNKYVIDHTIDTYGNKKTIDSNDTSTRVSKEDFYNAFKRYFEFSLPGITLKQKINSITPKIKEKFHIDTNYRPHESRNLPNNSYYLGISINVDTLNADLANNTQHDVCSTHNESTSINNCSDTLTEEILRYCESLIPPELKSVI